MPKLIALLLLVFGLSATTVQGQSPVRSNQLEGSTWKLVVEIDDDADTAFGRAIINAVDGFLEEIDIYMEFKSRNRLKVTVDAFGDLEVEYSEWHVDKEGRLHLGDTDHFESDDSVWMFEGRKLRNYEYDSFDDRLERDNVYLKRVRRH